MPQLGRVFTLTAVGIIRELADQGKSAPEIAKVIGSTAASVRVKCSQLKIKLKRRGRPALPRPGAGRSAGRRLVVYMRPADYAALNWKAARMQTSSDELAAMLLEAIINSDIYDAVLDRSDE